MLFFTKIINKAVPGREKKNPLGLENSADFFFNNTKKIITQLLQKQKYCKFFIKNYVNG